MTELDLERLINIWKAPAGFPIMQTISDFYVSSYINVKIDALSLQSGEEHFCKSLKISVSSVNEIVWLSFFTNDSLQRVWCNVESIKLTPWQCDMWRFFWSTIWC